MAGIGPRPSGWKGGSEDFSFLRQGMGPGHVAWNGYQESDPGTAESRASALSPSDSDLGCGYDEAGY